MKTGLTRADLTELSKVQLEEAYDRQMTGQEIRVSATAESLWLSAAKGRRWKVTSGDAYFYRSVRQHQCELRAARERARGFRSQLRGEVE